MTAPLTTAGAAIESRLRAADLGGAVIIVENTATQPSGPWVYLEIVGGAQRLVTRRTPGNHVYRQDGWIKFQCHVPAGSGRAGATTLAETIADLFRVQRFDGVQTWEPTAVPQPVEADGKWAVALVTVAFELDFVG